MLKIEKDLKEEKHPSIIRIANVLINNGKQDSLIANTLNKEHKNLKGMYEYVTSEAKKQAVSGSAMIEDETVFGWAQHYYDEDSIGKPETDKTSKPNEIIKPVELPKEDLGAFDI